jgi:sugar lactone lactonase YvrE
MRSTGQIEKPAIGSRTRVGRILAAVAVIAACGVSLVSYRLDTISRAIRGQRPSYGPTSISEVPNFAAIDRLIWVPGLDQGWDPQGLAIAEGSLFVSAYRSDGFWVNRGPCRVFRVDPETGSETGHFDVPPPCGHAGGVAYAGGGKLFIADTHTLFEVDLDRAFADLAPKFRIFPLGRGVKGAFAASGSGEIWIGDYEQMRPAFMLKYDLAVFESLKEGAALNADAAAAVVPIPSYAQGAAVVPRGKVWVSSSDLGWGFLDQLDAVTGRLERRYAIAGGTEGMAIDQDGRLWCVSEAGSRHLPLRYPFFPLIFRLNPARLSPAD